MPNRLTPFVVIIAQKMSGLANAQAGRPSAPAEPLCDPLSRRCIFRRETFIALLLLPSLRRKFAKLTGIPCLYTVRRTILRISAAPTQRLLSAHPYDDFAFDEASECLARLVNHICEKRPASGLIALHLRAVHHADQFKATCGSLRKHPATHLRARERAPLLRGRQSRASANVGMRGHATFPVASCLSDRLHRSARIQAKVRYSRTRVRLPATVNSFRPGPFAEIVCH